MLFGKHVSTFWRKLRLQPYGSGGGGGGGGGMIIACLCN